LCRDMLVRARWDVAACSRGTFRQEGIGLTADGTRLDPDRDSFEDEHQGHLNRLDSTHRDMYSAYARFLDTSPPRSGMAVHV
jgi:hypothetical protein